MTHSVLGVTLARGGSKGVPNKNIRIVAGKPLLVWTIEQAKLAGMLDYYIVSTDSTEIAAVAQEAGAAVLLRPGHLALDDTPAIDALIHALDWAEQFYEVAFDIVADCRTTNPMKLSSDIDGAVEKLIRTGADCVCGVVPVGEGHPSRLKMIFDDRLVPVWPEDSSGLRQDLAPPVFIRNGAIYVVRTSSLREGVFFLGGVTKAWEMPISRSVNIDTELDLFLADRLLSLSEDERENLFGR